jgi:hypothetical protein
MEPLTVLLSLIKMGQEAERNKEEQTQAEYQQEVNKATGDTLKKHNDTLYTLKVKTEALQAAQQEDRSAHEERFNSLATQIEGLKQKEAGQNVSSFDGFLFTGLLVEFALIVALFARVAEKK